MSVDYLSPGWETQSVPEQPKPYLPAILARQVLESGDNPWRPDYLSRQMADDIAWEIGARAMILPVHFRGVHSSRAGDSFAIALRPDNVIDIHSRR
ncbi:MAG TPA: hypothetical protein VFL81_00315 [Candidatus Saccharimonadales bacterium]|nr:hypothetical protein [Candidatus Saccharimonadales bacterium]